MIAKLIVKMYGGIWNVRERYEKSNNTMFKRFYFIVYSVYNYENASYVDASATFQGKPFFPHDMKSIFISSKAVIGKNAVIFQQVTIGSNTFPDSKGQGAPTIGDNVFIGAGAIIMGGITIGDNVRIGAGTVVYKDVPSHSVVISGEQRNIQREELDTRFYSWMNGKSVYQDDGVWKDV